MSPDIIPDITPDITPDIGSKMISYLVQDGLVPPLDKEASGIITVSEEIINLKAYASKHSLNARAINDLIKDVLKNPAFNADEVDTDMLKRLQASIDSGDIQIINMTVEGDGDQVLELFKRPVEKVLRELMADMRLAGHQHFAFHEYKDPRGNRLFAGHSNGFLHSDELGIPQKQGSLWTASELNAIITGNLVGGDHGHLHTFGCIQWECELFNGRPKARCYPFDIDDHRFRNKNRQVPFI